MSAKTQDRLLDMIRDETPGRITIRKYDPKRDPRSTLFDKVKLGDKYREKHKSTRFYSYYVDKDTLKELKKRGEETATEGGFLPALLPLLPLIFGGIGAASALAGGTASIVKAVNDKRASDIQNEEQRRYHDELLAQSKGGTGLSDTRCSGKLYKDFIKSLHIEKADRKLVQSILDGLGQIAQITKQGSGLYLSSYPM